MMLNTFPSQLGGLGIYTLVLYPLLRIFTDLLSIASNYFWSDLWLVLLISFTWLNLIIALPAKLTLSVFSSLINYFTLTVLFCKLRATVFFLAICIILGKESVWLIYIRRNLRMLLLSTVKIAMFTENTFIIRSNPSINVILLYTHFTMKQP